MPRSSTEYSVPTVSLIALAISVALCSCTRSPLSARVTVVSSTLARLASSAFDNPALRRNLSKSDLSCCDMNALPLFQHYRLVCHTTNEKVNEKSLNFCYFDLLLVILVVLYAVSHLH